jgi:hypothetical protein
MLVSSKKNTGTTQLLLAGCANANARKDNNTATLRIATMRKRLGFYWKMGLK